MSKITTPAMEKIQKTNTDRHGNIKKYSFTRDAWKRLKRNRTALFGMVLVILVILTAVFANVISPYDPTKAYAKDAFQPPSSNHWFGTDNIGRDLFSRCMYGTRVSLPLGLICTATSLMLGGSIGIIAAFFGGKADNVIMRCMDVVQAIPGTLLAMAIIAALGTGIPQLVVALTIGFLPNFSKTFRAAMFTVKGNEYIESSRSIGAGNIRLILRHMLPNCVGHVIIYAVGCVSASIMTVSMLSYLGLGIQPPTPEWGALLNAGKSYLTSYPHMAIFPGLMILITLLGFNLFGDGLRDALDPRLK